MSSSRSVARVDKGPASSALESRERQLRLWRMTMQARYAAVIGAGFLALTPPAGSHGFAIAVFALAVVVPYNAAYDLWMRRTGVLPPLIAYTDQILGVALTAFAPDLVAPVLLVIVAIDATSAVAFGRRVAFQAAALGAVGIGAVLIVDRPGDALASYLVALLTGTFIILVVGGVSQVERTLRQRYAELMGGIDAVVWEQLTRSPSTMAVNRRAEELFGYPVSAWQEPGFWRRIVHPDDERIAARTYREALRRGESRELEYRMIAADGRVVHVHDRMRVETDASGRAAKVRGVLLDVSARAEAEETMGQYVNLVERIQVALFVFELGDRDDDATLRLLAINPEGALITGAHPATSIGRPLRAVLRMPEVDQTATALANVVRTGEGWTVEDLMLHPSSPNARVYAARAFPLPGDAVGLSLQDVTERAIAAEVLRRQALHDELTGLPNRSLLNERLRRALEEAPVDDTSVALLLMDLDQFKEVNDALGHDHGDRLLVEISRRLVKVLRGVDTVARLGGDEFAVLLVGEADEQGALVVAQRIRRSLEQPFQLGGISLQTNASIGIALYPEHASEAETLTRRADAAMYSAKRSGTGVAVYSSEHDQSSMRRLTLLGELRRAIHDDELVLHYQPSLTLDSGDISCAEALVRWQHADHGLMGPGEFIELAEVSGLIQPLTRWVIDSAVGQVVTWNDLGIDLMVSVNLSVRNLYDSDLVAWLSDLLDERSIHPSQLRLEITESELMDDPLLAMEVLGKLKALGTSTSIDDFGTGYSSLAYLKHLPIDELKIDRSFVSSMASDESDMTIVRSTIDLSHNLGLDVVAEGVEDDETLAALAALGCDRAQGFTISRPVPAGDLTAWLTDDVGRAALRDRLCLPRSTRPPVIW